MRGCRCARNSFQLARHSFSFGRPGRTRSESHSRAAATIGGVESTVQKLRLQAYDQRDVDADLRDWSRSGIDDVAAQFKLQQERRQAFSAALRALSAMTPHESRDGLSQQTLTKPLFTSESAGPSTSRDTAMSTDSVSLHSSGIEFRRQLYQLTRPKAKACSETNGRLIALFNDSKNERYISSESYIIVLALCVRTYDFKLLRDFTMHAQRRGVLMDTRFCNTLLGIFVKNNSLSSWSAALQVFATMGVKADTSTWNQLLTLSRHDQKVFVIEQMKQCHVRADNVTMGILLPMQKSKFVSASDFVKSLNCKGWSDQLGDVLIGQLLQSKDSKTAVEVLGNPSIPVSVDGFNQVISHLRKIPASKMNHHKILQAICKYMTLRRIKQNEDTFLFLYKVADRVRAAGYRDMIYTVAAIRHLVTPALKRLRRAQNSQEKIKSSVRHEPWVQWVSPCNLGTKVEVQGIDERIAAK